jgi:hypothetical protein
MSINPFFTNLTQQQQQLMIFMEEHSLGFPRRPLFLFSMAQFVIRHLLAPMKPSSRNAENRLVRLRQEFLKLCSMKFGLYLSPQFIRRGRSQPINRKDIIEFRSFESLQNQFLALPHYGPAIFLGNTSAIAEISYRLFNSPVYHELELYSRGTRKVILLLLEYGISLGCSDCLGLMAYFCCIGYGYNSEKRNVLKIAGWSAETESIYGLFALARLLKDNSDRASYHDKHDDGIYIDECDLGVRQFVRSRIPLDKQIRRTLEERGCESCLSQFYDRKDECHYCGFQFDVFNHYSDDDDTSVPKSEQMRIAVKIYYKILSENPPSHLICIDVRKNLVKIYKAREFLFGGSIKATDEEMRRLEAI